MNENELAVDAPLELGVRPLVDKQKDSMKTVKGYIKTNRLGSTCEFKFEVGDDATEEQIEELAKDAAFSCVEWNYEVE